MKKNATFILNILCILVKFSVVLRYIHSGKLEAQMNRARILCLVALSCLPAAAQWPQFRGVNGSGVAARSGSEAAYPSEFSPAKNVVWKATVPYAQSSPVIAVNRVYLTTSDGPRLITLALDAKTGRELWRKNVQAKQVTKIFRVNDPASPTPAADDNGVVAFFADFGLVAYSADGQERWTHPMGPFKNFYGMAASPIIAGNLVIQICDQQEGSFVIALDRATGKQAWKTDRPGMAIGWATPMVYQAAKQQPQLVVIGSTELDGYDLATGKRLWWMPVGSEGSMGTPAANGETLLVTTLSSNEPMLPTFESALQQFDKNKDGRISHEEFLADKDMGEHFGWLDTNNDGFIDAKEWNYARSMGMGIYGAMAIQPGATAGPLKTAAVRWRFQKNLPYIPAPLLYQGVYYMVKDGGIITSLDASTGKLLKEGRSPEAIAEYFASPVAADGKVYLANVEGEITVLKAGGDWQVLHVNDLNEEIHATPALHEGRIYVRTKSAVYCFGAPVSKAGPSGAIGK